MRNDFFCFRSISMKALFLLLLISCHSSTGISQTEKVISIYFDVDADKPVQSEKDKLNSLDPDDKNIHLTRIVSYTDKSGSTAHNKALAQRRANTVENLLLKSGKPDQIIVKGEEYTSENYVAREFRRVDIFYREIAEEIIELIPEGSSTTYDEPPAPALPPEFAPRESHLVEEFTAFLMDSSVEEATIVLSIEFYGGTASFLNPDDPDLWQLFDILHYNENVTALIRGHVCCGYDMGLSERRSLAVTNFLTDRSIGYKRLTTKGYSNTIPAVSPELTEADRRKNRRVDVIFYKNY
jgi:outer membrane protein OmpA-like peptidoglycan-associated protein